MPLSIDMSKVDWGVFHKRLSEIQKVWENSLYEWTLKQPVFNPPLQVKFDYLTDGEEKTVTKSEQDRCEKMVRLLDAFMEDAGVLHQTQYNRIDEVRAMLKEMIAKGPEPEEKWYRIYWEEGRMYFTGLFTEEGVPVWCRDMCMSPRYSITGANEYLGKMKDVDGMTLDIRLVDGDHEEEDTETVKPGDVIDDGVGLVLEAVKETPGIHLEVAKPQTKWVVRDNNDSTYWNDGEGYWRGNINNAGFYGSREEAVEDFKESGHNDLEYIEVTVKDGKVEPVKRECGLKEIPKEEYYVIQRCGVYVGEKTKEDGQHALLVKDALKFSLPESAFAYIDAHACALWGKGIWNGKPEVRRVTGCGSDTIVYAPIERPQGERKYGVRIKEDGYLVKTPGENGAYPWVWNPLSPGYGEKIRRYTLAEAEDVLARFMAKENCLTEGARAAYLGVVEISADYKEVKPVKYVIQCASGRWIHSDLNGPSSIPKYVYESGMREYPMKKYASRKEAQSMLDRLKGCCSWMSLFRDTAKVEAVTA